MVRLSTIVILAGIVLLFIPIPPIATIAGAVVILIGLALRLLTDH
ncbi:transporter [Natronorubrum halophilum]|nr:transporter [Natronorubrum halophilum]